MEKQEVCGFCGEKPGRAKRNKHLAYLMKKDQEE